MRSKYIRAEKNRHDQRHRSLSRNTSLELCSTQLGTVVALNSKVCPGVSSVCGLLQERSSDGKHTHTHTLRLELVNYSSETGQLGLIEGSIAGLLSGFQIRCFTPSLTPPGALKAPASNASKESDDTMRKCDDGQSRNNDVNTNPKHMPSNDE